MERHEMAEKLVEKCGISYEEAGEVLKEANFDMLEAMIILERRGRLGSAPKNKYSTGLMNNYVSYGKKTAADAESFGEFMRIAWDKFCEVMRNVLRYHVVISREGREILSFPVLLAAVLLCFMSVIAVAAVIISLVNGCSYTIRKN